jgi:hypothetical protein
MKPVLMIAVVFGAVLAGAAGGYVASSLNTPEKPSAPRVASTLPESKTDDKPDLSPVVSSQGDAISSMRKEIDSLDARVRAAEAKVAQVEAEKDTLNKQIVALQNRPAPSGGGTTAPVVDPDSPMFKEAVVKAIEEKEAADRAARDAEREKQMAEFVANANKQMVDRLTTELALTSDQIPKIKAIIDDMSVKRREVWTKGEEARRNGTQFDWGAEMQAVTKASTDAVRAELSPAQLTTYQERVGDRGLSALERGFGGMGGGRGPGQGGPGQGGRGPRGGNNN